MHQVPATAYYGYQKEILGSTYVADDDYDISLKQAAPDTGGIRKLFGKLGLTANGWAANSWPLAEELHPTDWIAKQSSEVVEAMTNDEPFFLTASFYAPHPPLFPPKRLFEHYLQQKLPPAAHGDWVDWKSLTTNGNKTGDRVLLERRDLARNASWIFRAHRATGRADTTADGCVQGAQQKSASTLGHRFHFRPRRNAG